MIGKTISHYHVLERIGGGGMGIQVKSPLVVFPFSMSWIELNLFTN